MPTGNTTPLPMMQHVQLFSSPSPTLRHRSVSFAHSFDLVRDAPIPRSIAPAAPQPTRARTVCAGLLPLSFATATAQAPSRKPVTEAT